MNNDTYKKPVLYILLTAACVGLVFVYSRFSPEGNAWFPKCIFLQLTGLKCPGCGSQRVIHNLLNLNIQKAFDSQDQILEEADIVEEDLNNNSDSASVID